MMKVGIDSYSFHRYFGEIREGFEEDPGKRWTVFDLLDFAGELGIGGVSLETCYMTALDPGFLRETRSKLDAYGLECVLAWGHPTGLEGGTNPTALEDLRQHIPSAVALGTSTMRITASGSRYSPDLEPQFILNVAPYLREAVRAAADQGVVLALENHGDLSSDGLLRLIELIDSPYLRVTLDTGNAQRIEDAVEATRKLAPYVAATHIKDVAGDSASRERGGFIPSTPIGKGTVDIPAILRLLREAGYEGLLCIEIDTTAPIWHTMAEEEMVSISVDYLRGELSQLAAASS